MAKVGRWSTTPGSNNSTPPDGFPEGQAPSTLNDCAREMMASIRTVFQDTQYFDQDFTPTFINATSFSVPGNQTSAIHAGRRLKLNDANIRYGTVSTASFTTVTTIHVDVDSGASLTSSLSSFGIAILSVTNDSLPRNTNLTLTALAVTGNVNLGGNLSVSGVTALSTLTVSGAAVVSGTVNFHSTLSVSGTVVAANVAKAWGRFAAVTAPSITAGFNIASVSRSATGAYRVTFTNAMVDANYAWMVGANASVWPRNVSAGAASFKARWIDYLDQPTDSFTFNIVFYR